MDKVSKTEAEYTPRATMAEYCKDCIYYLGSMTNNCQKVLGFVRPKGWCKYWDEK